MLITVHPFLFACSAAPAFSASGQHIQRSTRSFNRSPVRSASAAMFDTARRIAQAGELGQTTRVIHTHAIGNQQIANGPTALGAGSPFRGAPLGGQPALATTRERSRTTIWSDVEGIEASVPTIDLPGKV